MRLQYIGVADSLSEKNIGRIKVLQEVVFGTIYLTDTALTDSHWWLAFDDGAPCGFCAVTIYDDEQKTAFLSLAGVLHSARGNGLQRRMIDKRVALAKEQGCGRVISYTSLDNIISANNLIKCGFKLYQPRWEWGVENAMYFEKKF